jgi:hypothetical protein
MWARVAVGAAFAIFLGTAALARSQAGQAGQAAPAQRLAILEPLAQPTFERIAGQTADLPWALMRVPTSEEADPMRRALEAAAQLGARAVLWITRDATSALVLRLYDPQHKRLLERRFEVEAGGAALAESAALEALALSVRSALQALSADEAVGEAVENGSGTQATASTAGAGQGAPPPTAGSQTKPEPADDQGTADDHTTGSEPSAAGPDRTAITLGAGWALALDGQSPVQQGPWARVGLMLGQVELAAHVQTALEAKLRDPRTRVTLQRRAALAVASLSVLRRSRVALALGVATGVASFARTTTSVAPGLLATHASDKLALALGLELRARFTLLAGSAARLGLELAASAMVLPAAPLLRYENGGQPVERRLWPVQPELRLGPYLQLPL